MYKIDKTKIYSVVDIIKVIDIIKGNFESSLHVKGYFTNSFESLNRPEELIANHYELKQINSLREDCFQASDGYWYKYFVPEDGIKEVPEIPEIKFKDSITLRDFLRIFDENVKSKRRIEVFVWDDKEYDGLISDIPEDFKYLDDEVVNFSTYIDDGFSECGERNYDKRTLALETVLTVFIED